MCIRDRYDTGLDLGLLNEVRQYFEPIRQKYLANGTMSTKVLGVDANTLLYQVPGGMFSNLVSQLKQAHAEDKLDDVSVSYTHLDVYKRQVLLQPFMTTAS